MKLVTHAEFIEICVLLKLDVVNMNYGDWGAIFASSWDEFRIFQKYMARIKVESGDTPAERFHALCNNPFHLEQARAFPLDEVNADVPVAASKIDMEEAYAHLPTADPRKHLFAFWSVRSARWRYVQTYYLTFGNVHSVYTYARFGRLCRTIFNLDFVAL